MGREKTLLVRRWIADGEKVRRLLASEGSKTVKAVCESISLRELGRRTGYSATYLSQVATGKTVISPVAFLKVCSERKPTSEEIAADKSWDDQREAMARKIMDERNPE